MHAFKISMQKELFSNLTTGYIHVQCNVLYVHEYISLCLGLPMKQTPSIFVSFPTDHLAFLGRMVHFIKISSDFLDVKQSK